jgi:hypothetical protein
MPRGDNTRKISSEPLFTRIGDSFGAAAKFALGSGISHQRLTNWKRRGIPAAELPAVAAALGISVEQYLKETGQATSHVARQVTGSYLTDDERELLDLYRAATGRWKIAIKHMAKLRGDDVQDEAAESMTILLAKIAATPVDDRKVEAAYGLPPGRAPAKKK